MRLQMALNKRLKINEPLKNKTTFKIGGRARFFYSPEGTSDLKQVLLFAKKKKIKAFVLGAGSNILVSDKGVNGLVLRLDSPFFKKISISGNCLTAGAGAMLAALIRKAGQGRLSGLEFLAGIPGTLGGALMMNAGAWGNDIAALIERVEVMDFGGRIKILSRKDIKFGYRESGLNKYIILSARLKLRKNNKKSSGDLLNKYLCSRRLTQDNSLPNAGCVFKNPQNTQAGKLIDLCGLKGRSSGGAVISNKHANFILNKANACSRDVLNLMKMAKKEVKDKFKKNLHPEIKIWH